MVPATAIAALADAPVRALALTPTGGTRIRMEARLMHLAADGACDALVVFAHGFEKGSEDKSVDPGSPNVPLPTRLWAWTTAR